MPLVSVKLPEATKAKVAQLAASKGVTAHAVMVQAIEAAVNGASRYDQFIADALQARDAVCQSDQVYDGAEFAAYIRARAGGDTMAAKPPLKSLASYVAERTVDGKA